MKKPRRRNRQPDPSAVRTLKEKPSEKLVRALELPAELLGDIAHIELTGNREAVIEGCKGVLEYDENIVKLNLGKMALQFLGHDLLIRNLSDESAVIEGFISSIEYVL